MNYIQWPWEIMTINNVLEYQGTSKARLNAPKSSARQSSLSPCIHPPSGTGRRHQRIGEISDTVVGTTYLDTSMIPNPPPATPSQSKENRLTANAGIQGVEYASNEQPCTESTEAYCRSHISYYTEQRPTRTASVNDTFANLVNSLDHIEESLKVLIHQYQQKDESYQAIGNPVSLIHESAINSNNSLDRLRDILGDEHSVLALRNFGNSPDQSHPDIHTPPALSRGPLVNVPCSVERMAREVNDDFQPSIERLFMPGPAAPPSDFGSRFPNPSHRQPASCIFYNPQEGPSNDSQPRASHVSPVEPVLLSFCEAAQGPGLERDDIGSRTSAGASLPPIAYYSPDLNANVMLESLTLQGEGEVDTPLSPHSILNTPVPRVPVRVRETSTPVSVSGCILLSTNFPAASDHGNLRQTDLDSPADAAQKPPLDHSQAQAASRHSTIVPEFPAPSTIDSMVQILRDIHSAQLIAIEQQHENMRYMRALNEWLERDARERRTEIRGMAENFHELRDYLYQLGSGPYPGLQPFNIMAPNPSLPHS